MQTESTPADLPRSLPGFEAIRRYRNSSRTFDLPLAV